MAGIVQDKVALVTGAASGIGRASALAFAREGAKVVVADINIEGGQKTVQMIDKAGNRAIFVKTDVTRPADVEALISHVVSIFGRLDCAHNNAGSGAGRLSIADCPEEDWARVIDLNLNSIFYCLKYEVRQMLKQGGGSIVNTASTQGLVATSMGGAAYAASKHGVVGLTKAAALQYATKNIRVNAVCPGTIRTPMIENPMKARPELEATFIARLPIGRLGRPEEVAEAVVWLCSDRASFVTGAPLSVDGGIVAQ